MKKILTIIAACIFLSVNAQTVPFIPKTGDSETDKILVDINNKAIKDLNAFKDNVQELFELPIKKTEELLQVMNPGDVFMVAQIAQVTTKPIDDVVVAHEKTKTKGWGATAKELGIKPGSKEFHALKGKLKENKEKGPKGEKGEKGSKGGKGKGKGSAKTKQ